MRLLERVHVKSPVTDTYNCVAWAVGVNDVWWWPDALKQAYWPENVPREESVAAFMAAFETQGFREADPKAYEPGMERIAILSKDGARPSHVAREVEKDRWASKLGRSHDVEHTLQDLETDYGSVCKILVRRRT